MHPVFWLEDGSVVLRLEGEHFKVHAGLISRLSRVMCTLTRTASADSGQMDVVCIPEELGVTKDDFVVLLEHLYHDA